MGNRELGTGNAELSGFFCAGYCNVHMRGTGIDKTVGRGFGTGQDVTWTGKKILGNFQK